MTTTTLLGMAVPDLPDGAEPSSKTLTRAGVDVEGMARDLIGELVGTPRGQVSPSVYETGRLVTLAPWLTGHSARLRYLLAAQRADGGWGGPGAYALGPTLSAVEAFLSTLRSYPDGAEPGVDPASLVKATDHGLRMLLGTSWGRGTMSIPDMPAVELIVPALTASINEQLWRQRIAPIVGLDQWQDRYLSLPEGMDERKLTAVRTRLMAGAAVPPKLLHALEVVGDAAAGAMGINALPPGTVGASPAATAAWLGRQEVPPHDHECRRYLEAVVRQHRGPVPCATPITAFERAWVLSWLAQAGIPVAVPAGLLTSLRPAARAGGIPAGPGLPPDADTTSAALYALGRLGEPHEPYSLWEYRTDTHFCTWRGEEEGQSVTVNAHVLEAFGQYLHFRSDAAPRYAGAVRELTHWLCGQQGPDGRWRDRWHASPYYATACAVLALHHFGWANTATTAVGRAVDWTMSTQHSDGSWGYQTGTVEETAYAMRILMTRSDGPTDHAVALGYSYLLRSIRSRSLNELADPPQWHDKDLYSPATIVRAAVLAAVHQAQRRLGTR